MIRQIFGDIPVVVKNLLIINGLFFLATITLGDNVFRLFALHQFQSPDFMPHQLVTHMFMHDGLPHLLMNMFTLWMFGRFLEAKWQSKRFLTYYIITGLGAALLYIGFVQFQIYEIANNFPDFLEAARNGKQIGNVRLGEFIPHIESEKIHKLVTTPMVGASGAVFGILLAFGLTYPDSRIHLFVSLLILLAIEWIFKLPIPITYLFMILFILSRTSPEISHYILYTIGIKAKYLVFIFAAIELSFSLKNDPGDNIAHVAHLGGMIFGFLLLTYWKKKGEIWF
jgi:membrane associated rhomboid family serine protease